MPSFRIKDANSEQRSFQQRMIWAAVLILVSAGILVAVLAAATGVADPVAAGEPDPPAADQPDAGASRSRPVSSRHAGNAPPAPLTSTATLIPEHAGPASCPSPSPPPGSASSPTS